MIENGTIVNVHYTGKLTDGSVFDTSEGRGTLQFEIGSGQIIPGFEKALIGKNTGDKVTINITPDEAYGPVYEELFVKIPKDKMPGDVEVGQVLQATNEENVSNVLVMEVNDDHVLIDGNHPLAGKELVFDIEVVSVN
jgi:FKBP-type peptidyl-prolyl cis-trans isomerase 2